MFEKMKKWEYFGKTQVRKCNTYISKVRYAIQYDLDTFRDVNCVTFSQC